jgi:hypothetical protein
MGMTREASTVLFFNRVVGIFAEGDGHLLPATRLGMRFPRTVAGLATPFFVRLSRVGEGLSHHRVVESTRLILMARGAGV